MAPKKIIRGKRPAAELRRQAEAKWSEHKKKTGPLLAGEADNLRLVHELEVHQIELEMQNEELAQSCAEVEALLRQFADLYDFAPVGYFTLARDGAIRQVNLAGARLLGVEVSKLIKRRFGVFVSVESRPAFNAFLEKVFTSGSKEACEVALLKDWLGPLWVHMEASTEDKQECHAVIEDITARKHAEDRIQRQLEHLTALSGIDRVITANYDLDLSLSEIIKHVMLELGVDAAVIFLFNPYLQILEFGAESGFRSKAIRKAQIRLGEGFAGHVAQERRLVQIPNLQEDPLFHTSLLVDEDFVCGYGVPLIIKGQVKGVMEVFQRAALKPDSEWLDFLNTLAGQAAIAVEIATLFESLQRSNLELSQAYDVTIEGWSHALDLRDEETEGHTQRVTEVTVKLGRAFGLSEAELVQVRWGALLHDIGKMGIPDAILLKPEPLTDEEWVKMKKHPTFAYELLSPIYYLRLALDIPYCHHEKWDGTGYPRGLKGDQIPFAARIFAVVDVWDALSSDRPYRPAWPEEKTLDHIRSLSGTHFDPQVVKFCLDSGLLQDHPKNEQGNETILMD